MRFAGVRASAGHGLPECLRLQYVQVPLVVPPPEPPSEPPLGVFPLPELHTWDMREAFTMAIFLLSLLFQKLSRAWLRM